MYLLTKLCGDNQQFVSSIVAQNKGRSTEMSIAIAKVLAYQLTLPTDIDLTEDLNNYYTSTHSLIVNGLINSLNELLVIDIPSVKDYVLKFYKFRFESVFPPAISFIVSQNREVEDFFRISRIFSDIDIQVIKNSSKALSHYLLSIDSILKELNSSEGN